MPDNKNLIKKLTLVLYYYKYHFYNKVLTMSCNSNSNCKANAYTSGQVCCGDTCQHCAHCVGTYTCCPKDKSCCGTTCCDPKMELCTLDQNGMGFCQKAVLFKVISAAGRHTLGVANDSTVWAWGNNSNGQLGDGSTSRKTTPTKVEGNLIDVISVAAGRENFSLALKSDGTVWSWGSNANGQLGIGSSGGSQYLPVQVSGLTDVIAIAAGGAFSLALKKDGTVWSWGKNSEGQLGHGTTSMSTTPKQVIGGLKNVIDIAGGGGFALAVTSDGSLWSWGENNYYQLGDGTKTNNSTPKIVKGVAGVNSVTCGRFFALALKNDGTVWAWGQNNYAQLGNGSTSTFVSTPALVGGGLQNVIDISGGNDFSLALKNDGTVWAWGINSDGQLGNNTKTTSTLPGQVHNLTNVIAIATGDHHSQSIKDDSKSWAWGANSDGQLGSGNTTSSSVPIMVISPIL